MSWTAFAAGVIAASRIVVLATALAAGFVAVTQWAVRHRHLNPFGPFPRTIRRLSDPVLRPLERRMVRWGRNPQDAPLWLVGIAIFGGILVLSVLGWALGWVEQLLWLRQGGATAWIQFVATTVTQVLMLALLVRVIGSWVGATEFTPWMRPFVLATEWLVGPIRRRLPPLGPLDLSPIVAYFALILIRAFVFFLVR